LKIKLWYLGELNINMAVLLPVLVTDTFDVWRQKTNLIADRANNISIASDLFALEDPVNDGDLMVWDETTNKFTNVASAAFIAEVFRQYDLQASQLKPYYFASLRNIF